MATITVYKHNRIEEWKHKSKLELKQKIKSNLEKRGAKLTEITNTLITQIVPNTPIFYSHQSVTVTSINRILTKVDEWRGVNVQAMHKQPQTFSDYHKRSDNWWNRYKAEWIGDYLFYPFLKTQLTQFLSSICENNQIVVELVYFMIFAEILNAEIYYHRTKGQPLLLDQSFIKSKDLKNLFSTIGLKNRNQWQIPTNNTNGRYRITVRNYVKQWVSHILGEKQMIFNVYFNSISQTNININNTNNINMINVRPNPSNNTNTNAFSHSQFVRDKMDTDTTTDIHVSNININPIPPWSDIPDMSIYPIAQLPNMESKPLNLIAQSPNIKSEQKNADVHTNTVSDLEIGYNWSHNYNNNSRKTLAMFDGNRECNMHGSSDTMRKLTYLQSRISDLCALKTELTALLESKTDQQKFENNIEKEQMIIMKIIEKLNDLKSVSPVYYQHSLNMFNHMLFNN